MEGARAVSGSLASVASFSTRISSSPRRAVATYRRRRAPTSSTSSKTKTSSSLPRAFSPAAAAAADDDGGGGSGDSGGGSSSVRWCAAEEDRTSTTSDGGVMQNDDYVGDTRVRWHRLETRWEADEEAAMDGDLLDLLSPAWRILLLSDGSVTRHLRLLCPQLRQTRLECLRQGPISSTSSSSSSSSGGGGGAGGGAGGGGGGGGTSEEVLSASEGAPSEGAASRAGLGLPDDCALISGPMVQREVLLRISRGNGDGEGKGGDVDGGPSTSGTSGGDDDVPMVYAASWWSRETFDKYMTDSANPMWTNLRSQHVELYREIRKVYMGDNAELEEIFGRPGPFWGRHYIFWHENRPMTVVYEVFNPMLEQQLGPAEPPAR